MVRKCIVLFRIQDLQKRACRVSAIILRQFVDLIQYHDRVGDTASLHAFHDAAGHGADVGAAVPADLCLIPDAAKADPHIFSPERAGDALADAGLAGAGSPHKEEDGAVLLPVERHDSELLDDALLYLFESVVILVKDGFCTVQVDGGHFRSFPGKAGHKVDVVIEKTIFVAVLSLLAHPVQDLLCLAARLGVHV